MTQAAVLTLARLGGWRMHDAKVLLGHVHGCCSWHGHKPWCDCSPSYKSFLDAW